MHPIPSPTDLTLDERIGQTLCFGWQGATPDESLVVSAHARALVEEMRVGSIVLLGRNLRASDPERARATFAELQSLARVPLFIAIDQEGGTVNRLRAPFHEFPGNMALGAVSEDAEELARRQAEAQARELLALGINWNFAPVVDVNNNPDNPIIGVRSYGENPERVGRLGAAAVRGYQGAGMLACAKHFPGHGDTSVDSHLALPTVPGDRARIEAVELVPFRAVIAADVGAFMTTHILFPALDAARPATLSPAILTGLLRRELGYGGVVITDCLEMKAIADTVGTPRGAVEALKAGADVALVCHTLETQRATVAAIRNAVQAGELPEERVNEAAGRVLAAKRRFLAEPPPAAGTPWLDPAHDALEREIARRSVTFVRNGGALPLRLRPEQTVAVVSAHHALPALVDALRTHFGNVRPVALAPQLGSVDAIEAIMAAEEAEADAVIVATAPPEPWSDTPIDQRMQAALVRELVRVWPDTVVVALREPYDLRRFPEVRNYICGYGYRPATLAALADALAGAFAPTGRLPVTVPVEEAGGR